MDLALLALVAVSSLANVESAALGTDGTLVATEAGSWTELVVAEGVSSFSLVAGRLVFHSDATLFVADQALVPRAISSEAYYRPYDLTEAGTLYYSCGEDGGLCIRRDLEADASPDASTFVYGSWGLTDFVVQDARVVFTNDDDSCLFWREDLSAAAYVAVGPDDFCDLSTFDGTYVAVGARIFNVVTGSYED